MEYITTKSFKEKLNQTGYLLVDFYADWCGPCKMLSPILDEINKEKENIEIVKVDADNEVDLVNEYGIKALPTVIMFKDGEIIDSMTGAYPKEKIIKFIDGNME